MDAAADYKAAVELLARPLPAYVSYTARSHVKFDAIVHDATSDIVVRTKDGIVIKGKGQEPPPYVQIGTEKSGPDEAITAPAFVAHCYSGASARTDTYEGAQVEAISLKDSCEKSPDDKDFDTLYVNPVTHHPIAAVGTDYDSHVAVRLVQTFADVSDYVLPSSLYVRVKGSGLMMWLDVLYDRRYENFRFSATEPT